MSLPEFNLRGTLDKGVHVCKSDEFLKDFAMVIILLEVIIKKC